MAHSGYDRDRFTNLPFDSFDCIICSEIVVDPMECDYCGKMFCKICINDWMSKSPATKCPNRCKSQIVAVRNKPLLRMYSSLDIKCSNANCDQVVKLQNLIAHESQCKKVKCFNYKICKTACDDSIRAASPCCSQICLILLQLTKNFGNQKKMYQILSGTFGNYGTVQQMPSSQIALNWDSSKFGTGILISDNSTQVYLKEEAYVFRSVTGNIGFTHGINYWEIIADGRTQNELKIGITGSKDFDMNSAFCDHPTGYAYYGLGQLRNGSNASGSNYGKKFKKAGILGICLDMNKGVLSFALDGEFMGVAFTSDKLKKGPYYPAVSLLHHAGCKIKGGSPLPSYFK